MCSAQPLPLQDYKRDVAAFGDERIGAKALDTEEVKTIKRATIFEEGLTSLSDKIQDHLLGNVMFALIKSVEDDGASGLLGPLAAILDQEHAHPCSEEDLNNLPVFRDVLTTLRGLRVLADPAPFQFVHGTPEDVQFVMPYGAKKDRTLAKSSLKAAAALSRQLKNSPFWVNSQANFIQTVGAAESRGNALLQLFKDLSRLLAVLNKDVPQDDDAGFQKQEEAHDLAATQLYAALELKDGHFEMFEHRDELRPGGLQVLMHVMTSLGEALHRRVDERMAEASLNNDDAKKQDILEQKRSLHAAIKQLSIIYSRARSLFQSISDVILEADHACSLQFLETAVEVALDFTTIDTLRTSYNKAKNVINKNKNLLEKLDAKRFELMEFMLAKVTS